MARLKCSLTAILAACQFFMLSATQAKDQKMLVLANDSGCFICHKISPDSSGDAQPLAPSYEEIALRYRGDMNAFGRLLDRVLHGTVYQEQVWDGKVGMRFMPPNVNVSREDASSLVNWILNLDIDSGSFNRERMYDLPWNRAG